MSDIDLPPASDADSSPPSATSPSSRLRSSGITARCTSQGPRQEAAERAALEATTEGLSARPSVRQTGPRGAKCTSRGTCAIVELHDGLNQLGEPLPGLDARLGHELDRLPGTRLEGVDRPLRPVLLVLRKQIDLILPGRIRQLRPDVRAVPAHETRGRGSVIKTALKIASKALQQRQKSTGSRGIGGANRWRGATTAQSPIPVRGSGHAAPRSAQPTSRARCAAGGACPSTTPPSCGVGA